jgi:hypothetical protein
MARQWEKLLKQSVGGKATTTGTTTEAGTGAAGLGLGCGVAGDGTIEGPDHRSESARREEGEGESTGQPEDRVVQLGSDCWVALLEGAADSSLFVINGFYSSLQAEFGRADNVTVCFTLRWSALDLGLGWADMCESLVGDGPAQSARAGSIKSHLWHQWRELGLLEAPSPTRACLRMSDSAFAAAVHCSLWGYAGLFDHTQGLLCALIARGIPGSVLARWATNPQLRGRPVLDHFRHLSTFHCLEKAVSLFSSELASCFASTAVHCSAPPS